ncbi:restriction endonuclease subunit S [Proteus penneri]|uniref:restriction endonuclease subunit S n=1 Tax=Proteus penneri TaxID=102862 RepID=UPI001EFAB034|nr:restriction endonuclease subunit S [Proteus penneri]
MCADKKVPEIRFKGFSGEWLNNPIGEICGSIFGGGTPSTSEKSFWQGNIPWIQSSDIADGDVSSVNAKKYITKVAVNKSATKLISGNSIAIVTRVGVGKLSLMKDRFTTSQDFLSLSDLKVDAQFSAYAIWKQLQIEKEQVQGTSIKGITKEELLSKIITFPKSKVEQTTIGNYFQKLDNLINQHQQKHDKLNNIKKAMLEKMFPKQGETVPEIRFKGFRGEWLNNSIGEICGSTFGGGTPSTSEKSFWQGNIPWIQSSDIADGDVSSVNAKKYITKVAINKSATKLISGNSIAIVTRVGVGKLSLMKDKFATSQDFLSLSDLKVDAQFSAYAIWKQLQIEKEQVQGTSIKGITKEELLSKIITFPKSKLEQIAIGNYFQKLDELINQHQQQITKLNHIKQACLSKMFI